MRWRKQGTTAWTNGAFFELRARVSNVPFSRPATGLTPGSDYEFQACGKERSYPSFVCVGPDGTTGTTQAFRTPTEQVFARPGAYSFFVPEGVTRATFELWGAEGGRGHEQRPPEDIGFVDGGRGALVRATLAVSPGSTYPGPGRRSRRDELRLGSGRGGRVRRGSRRWRGHVLPRGRRRRRRH